MTIQQHASFDAEAAGLNATSNTNPAVSKMVKLWESKNAQRALKGSGLTLMAMSLTACGGEDITQAQLDAQVALAEAAAAEAAAAAAAQAAAEAEAADAAAAEAAAEEAAAAAEAARAAAEAAEAAAQAELDALFADQSHTLDGDNDNDLDAALGLGNDTIDGSVRNSLQTGDSVEDTSTVDSDVLNANVTVANAAPTLRNIETVNVTGEFLSSGLALTNVTGTNTLNLSTSLVGGTATVTDVSAVAVSNVVIGDNVTTVNITAVAAGTGAAGVVLNAGASTVVNVNDSAGDDIYTVTAAADATVTSTLADADDSLTLNIGGDTSTDTVATLGTLNINSAVEATVTEATGLGVATDFTGAGDIVLSTTGAIADAATEVTSTGTGSLTLTLTTVANDDVSTVLADVVNHAHATGTGLTVNGNTTLNLDEAAGAGTMNLDAAGTLVMTVSETQTAAITTGANVTALTLSATPDEAADTAAGAVITMADLALHANTVNVAIIGSDDLTLTALSNNGGEIISATSMTGDLTIDTIDADATIFTGSGDDSITVGTDALTILVRSGAGDDTIDGSAEDAGTDALTAFGEAGDDTITGGDAADTLDGGAGDDTINGDEGADSITTGDGSDTVIIVSGEDGDTVTDFVMGTDMLVLTGAAGAAVDLSATTPTAGVYAIDGAGGNFDVTLTGNTATDLQDSVTLGTQATAAVAAGAAAAVTTYTAFNTGAFDVTAGDADDVIEAGGAVSVTTGSGSDTVIAAIGNNITVTDFVLGTDTLIITGAATASVDLTAVTPTAGAYTLGADTHTLTGNTATDLSGSVVLGIDGTVFTAFATGSVTGGTGNDNIATAAVSIETVVFIDNGGVDTITVFEAAATEDLLDFDSLTGIAATGVVFAAGDAKVNDALDGEVYVFDDEDLTGVSATFDFNGADDDAALGSAEVLASAAAYLEAALTEANGENYVALINTDNGGTDLYVAYLVDGDSDGIDANDLTLLGSIDADAVLDAGNIV